MDNTKKKIRNADITDTRIFYIANALQELHRAVALCDDTNRDRLWEHFTSLMETANIFGKAEDGMVEFER